MTIVYEFLKINGSILIVQFMFDSHNVKIGKNGNVQGYSLDKYLSLDVWSQIYTKLNDSIERAAQKSLIDLKKDVISMRRAQLELKISYKTTEPFHTDIVRLECDNSNVHPHVMLVNVETFSDVRGYKKAHPSKNHQSNGRTEPKNPPKDDEYIPTPANGPITDGTAMPVYTPSKVKSERHGEYTLNDEYMPSGANKNDDISYSPQKIIRKNSKSKAATKKTQNDSQDSDVCLIETPSSIDHNENNYKDDGTTMILSASSKASSRSSQNLFGSSDDDSPKRSIPRTRSQSKTETKISTRSGDGSKNERHKLTDWNQTDRLKSKNSKPSSSGFENDQKKRRIEKVDRSESQQKSKKPISASEEIALLHEMNQRLALQMEKTKPVIPDVIFDLKEFSIEEILGSFDEHKEKLKGLFNKLKYEGNVIALRAADMIFSNVIAVLLTREQQTAMIEALTEKLGKSKDFTKYGSLFWTRLMPEWALEIFMANYLMNRKEALHQLRLQMKHEADNTSLEELLPNGI